jgi:Tfp pilus assembly protein PilN
MSKKPASINLLTRKQTLTDVILVWALTTGRLIIIIVETVALSAFLYRFTLDRQIADLNEDIKQKQAIIEFYKKDEAKFRLLQTKLITLTDVEKKSMSTSETMNDIVSIARNKAILQNMTIQDDSVQITAITPSISLMNSFISGLKSYPKAKTVNISQIENDPETNQISLSLEISFVEKNTPI